MHSMPTRIVLAGSVLALGSVGTVSAVHLESAPLGTTPGTPLALTPVPATPATTKAPEALAPVRVLPTPKDGSTARTKSDERAPLNAKDLVDLAAGPLPKRTVTVALHQIEDAADSDSDDSDSEDSDSDSGDDEDTQDFAGHTSRHWSGRTDGWRGHDAQDGSRWGRRISNPFQAAQQWRDSGPRSYGVSSGARSAQWESRQESPRWVSSRTESSRMESSRMESSQWDSSDRDYVGRHRADC
ncbi:MAG: hypothetical protein QOD04_4694 [Pseudonocardiales bacterium]|nr:hypothetical protein [Pseudonocardiales bacterium]